MTNEQQTLCKQINATFDEAVAELKACTKKDYILYWPQSQLAVAFDKDNKPYACSPARADEIGNDKMSEEAWAYTPIVRNGKGEPAHIWDRQKAIEHDLTHIESARKHLTRGAA